MRKVHILLGVLTICLCSGCMNKKENTDKLVNSQSDVQTEIINYVDFPQSYHRAGEKVTLDTEIHAQNVYFKKANIKEVSLDNKKISEILVPDSDVFENETEYYAEHTVSEDIWERYLGNEYTGSYLKSSYFKYTRTDSIEFDIKSDVYNLDLYTEPKEFSYGTSEECLDKVKNILSDCDISIDNMDIYTYYLDHEILKSEEKYLPMPMDSSEPTWVYENREEWSEHDDMYVYFFHKKYCGLDIQMSYQDNWSLAQISNAHITALYGEDGLVYLCLNDLEISEQNEYMEFVSFDNVADTIINHYDMLIDNNTYKVTNARLIIDCDMEGNACPVWVFDLETILPEYSIKSQIRINALTGEWW